MQRLVAFSFYRSLLRESKRIQKTGLHLFSPLSSEEIVRKFGQGGFIDKVTSNTPSSASTATSAAASVFQSNSTSSIFILALLSELSLLQKDTLSAKDVLAAVKLGFSKQKNEMAIASGGLDVALIGLQTLTRLISNSDTNTSTVTSYFDTLVKISVTTSPVPGLPVSIQTAASHFPFAYRVKIENVGTKTFQILSRQWTFQDSNGKTIEVPKGSPRIVGHAPILKPGQIFEYVSGVELRTARGTMKGSLRVSVIDEEEKEKEKEEEFEHRKVEERENNKKGIISEKNSTLATQFDALVAETVLVQ